MPPAPFIVAAKLDLLGLQNDVWIFVGTAATGQLLLKRAFRYGARISIARCPYCIEEICATVTVEQQPGCARILRNVCRDRQAHPRLASVFRPQDKQSIRMMDCVISRSHHCLAHAKLEWNRRAQIYGLSLQPRERKSHQQSGR